MVISYLDISRLVGDPLKANAPLVIDADSVLAGAIALEFLQPVTGDSLQILQGVGVVEVDQFTARRTLDLRRELSGELTSEDLLGFLGREGFDHGRIVSPSDNIVKR